MYNSIESVGRQAVYSGTGKLELAEAGRLLYDFFWGDFADWYIEVRNVQKDVLVPILADL